MLNPAPLPDQYDPPLVSEAKTARLVALAQLRALIAVQLAAIAARRARCCIGYARPCPDCMWHPSADKALKLQSLKRAATIRTHGRVAPQFLSFRSKSGWRPTDGRKPGPNDRRR